MPRPRAKRSIYIEALPEDVYDFALGDLESLPDWMTSVDKVESADANWPAIGSSHVYSRTVGERTITGRTTVVEAERPRRVRMREEFGVGEPESSPERSGWSIWTFEPEGSGTRATMETVGADLKTVTYVLWKLLLAGRIAGNLDRTLASLKRICEEELEDAES